MSAPPTGGAGARRRALADAARLPLAVALTLAALAAAVWADSDEAQRAALASLLRGARLAMMALLLLPLLAWLGWLQYRQRADWRAAAEQLSQGTALIARANPAHRLAAPAAAGLEAVAAAINDLAQERALLLGSVRDAVSQAQAGVELERNRFAALIGELDQSVLVCNRQGRILLYNAAVQRLFAESGEDCAPVGLGRSVFGLIDRGLIRHALDALERQAGRGECNGVQFVSARRDGRLLRVHFAALPGPPGSAAPAAAEPAGFVLLLTDVTEQVERDARSVGRFQDLVELARRANGGIRAALDTLLGEPPPEPARRAAAATAIRDEAQRLSDRIEALVADVSARLYQRWPLEQMRGADLLELAGRRIGQQPGLAVRIDAVDADLWLRVDSFTLVQAVFGLACRLQDEFAVREVALRLEAAETESQVRLELAWHGVPMSSETAYSWQNDAYTLGGENNPLSLAQVMERHGGEAWYQRDAPLQTNRFALRLPRCAARRARIAAPAGAGRPEFYDFDLFQAGADAEALDHRPLLELTYTVFDTETTGLDPNRGDEIIAIGAVRIVRGRVLRAETFETLVDPQRSVPSASSAVHGITAAMLQDQPPIGQALGRFWRFAEDTVLVGHNAAFDMRFLQLKEDATGVRFRQPVLDTLLLAAVAQPAEMSHGLEAIAARLGVEVVGRHTALGDALATAEVFLRLLPLLAAQGIRTLGEAREAAERTYYARLKY